MDRTKPQEHPFESLRRQFGTPMTGMSDCVADGDQMFHDRTKHYRSVGQSAWRCIASALLAAEVSEPRRILDMPCGHGRVMRVLRQAFPDAVLTGCDLERSGVDFCAQEFGAIPHYSNQDLSQVHFEAGFDLIWVGSLVTHLDAPDWHEFFRLLLRSLQPNGVAVMTFHGRWAAYLMQQGNSYGLEPAQIDAILQGYASSGFGYSDYPSTKGYGISLSSPAWLMSGLQEWQQLRFVALSERQWDDHQDVLAIQRIS